MRRLRDIPIRQKLVFIAMGTSVLALVLACAIFVVYDWFSFRRELAEEVATTAEMLGYNCAASLSFDEPGSARETLASLHAQPNILAACVYDRTGKVFASYLRAGSPPRPFPTPSEGEPVFQGRELRTFRAINFEGDRLGTIYIVSDLQALNARWLRYLYTSLVALVLVSAVALLLIWRLQRVISRPIFHLAEIAARVARERNYSARADKHGEDELGQLIDAFNEMLTQIEKQDAALQGAQQTLELRVAERTRELEAEIRERAETEAALRITQFSVDHAVEAIFWVGADGRFEYVNDAACDSLGFSRPELLKLGVAEINPDVSAHEWPALWQGKRQRGSHTFQSRHRTKDGRVFPVEVTINFIDFGNRGMCQASVRDITERKRIEADLAQALDAALESGRLKAEFLATVSHEIRTPMNGVIGMTTLLLDSGLNPQQRDYAETIRTSADSLLVIINDILDFSKIEAGKLRFEILDFDLREVIESTLELHAPVAQFKGLELVGYVAPELPDRVRGDPGRFRQVLNNLLGNAIKFTSHGEVVVEVSRVAETDLHVTPRIEVRDTGIGLSEESQSRLFRAFIQADGSTTRKFGGTGLGLVISKRLVENMGGEIGVESRPGEGARFWFTIRLEKQASVAKVEAAPVPDWSALRVLVVDDNATNRRILGLQLRAWRLQSLEVSNGADALEALRREARSGRAFDVALLDLQMPDLDGLSLARLIKSEALIAGVRLVLVTSLSQQLSAEELRAAGILDCLAKPVKSSRLQECFARVVGDSLEKPSSQVPAPASEPASADAAQIPKTRILVAEDNSMNQKVILAQLKKLGYAADAVASGLEVIRTLHHLRYDVILMDCQMPDMDGFEATRSIRRAEQHAAAEGAKRSTIYIIAVTANAMRQDRERCLAAGMDDYISKPVKQAELQRALERRRSITAPQSDGGPALFDGGPGIWREDVDGSDGTVGEGTGRVDLPLSLAHLEEISNHDAVIVHELIDLYFRQADLFVANLYAAVKSSSMSAVQAAAHEFLGATLSCGFESIAPALREVERLGRLGQREGLIEAQARAISAVEAVLQFLLEYRRLTPVG